MNVVAGGFPRAVWLCLLWANLALPLLAGQTYYVSPAGVDTHPGTQAQPLRQIRMALTKARPGDLVLVADGTYRGFDVDGLAGTSDAPIRIQAQGTNAVVQPTTDRPDNRDTIYILDSTYVVIDGLRSFNANRAALRIQSGHHITIRNCVFGDNATWGILTGHSPDLWIEGNECYGSAQQHGIYVANSADRPVVRGNRCHHNYQCGIQLNADQFTPPGDGIITGALIENNVLYDNGAGGGGALNLDGVQDSVIRNNLVFTNHASGIILFQIDGSEGPRGNWIYHNTIDQASNGRWALGLKQTTGTNYVRNNVLHNRHSYRGGLEFASAADAANTDSDYNIVSYITTDDGDSRLTLAQWQATGHDAHSKGGSAATLFVDASGGNYLLQTDCAAVNAALPLPGAAVDLEGLPRPFGAAPDIGCYEQRPLALELRPAGANVLRLKLAGGAGRTFRVDYALRLTNWTTLASLVRSHLPMEMAVPNQGTNRFFRAAALP